MIKDPRERKVSTDLGADRDGYGRILADDPVAACIRQLVSGKAVEIESEVPSVPKPPCPVAPLEGDVPSNGYVQKHLAEGFALLEFRCMDREEAKEEANRQRAEGKRAVYVTLKFGRFGVFSK